MMHPAREEFFKIANSMSDECLKAMERWWYNWVESESIEAVVDKAIESRALAEAQRWQQLATAKAMAQTVVANGLVTYNIGKVDETKEAQRLEIIFLRKNPR